MYRLEWRPDAGNIIMVMLVLMEVMVARVHAWYI